MKKKSIIILSVIIILITSIVIYIYIGVPKVDPELNSDLYYEVARNDEYLKYYKNLFEDIKYENNLKMSMHWIIMSYEDVYSKKEKTFYNDAIFESLTTEANEKTTQELLNLYNSDNEKYHYLKPYLDCYLLMNKEHEVSKEELENIKSTILYAIDYYINGVDYKE